jgi:hypothetical protein
MCEACDASPYRLHFRCQTTVAPIALIMMSFIRDLLKTKLRLGYLLLLIYAAAMFFGVQRWLAPNMASRVRVIEASTPPHAPRALPPSCQSTGSTSDSHNTLSINAPQLESIERYFDATAAICSSEITSEIGSDPKLGIEPDIAQWYFRPLPGVSPPHFALTRPRGQVRGVERGHARSRAKLRAGGRDGKRRQRLDVHGR